MARVINKEEYEQHRNEILDATQRLVYTKGYEGTSIQDILTELKISKGAFYHYFDSRQSLLEALIERLAQQMVLLLTPIVEDSSLTAGEKLERFFDVAARWKTDRKDYLLTLVSAWYADENAIMRLKTQTTLIPFIEPLLASIVTQGVSEGIFHTAYPTQVSDIIFSLLQSFGDTLIPMIMKTELASADLSRLDGLASCYQDAVERVLGAEPGSLPLFDTAILREWFPLSTNYKE